MNFADCSKIIKNQAVNVKKIEHLLLLRQKKIN